MRNKFCIITKSLRKGRRKLSGNRGVSLVEMLLCVLILLLSTGVTVSTLDLGIAHFKARTRETEQRLLCNTLSVTVQEYLTYVNEIEVAPDGKLKRFKTGAIAPLESRWCEFVGGTYYRDDRFVKAAPEAEGGPWKGQIAIEYSKNDAPRYYMLADKAQYIVKKNAPDDVKLEATLTVEWNDTAKRFNVTITVNNKEGLRTQEAENNFIVIPINPNVIVTNQS